MFSERSALIALIALSVLTLGMLTAIVWRRRRSPLGQTFLFFALLGTIYNFGYMCELASNNLADIRFWLRVESVGIAFLPTSWTLLAIRHTNDQNNRWPKLTAVMLMLSSITFILSNTSEIHHLHYGPLALNPAAPFPVVTFVPGPWYWVHTIFTNLALLLGNIFFARALIKAPPDMRQQAFVLFLGSLFPWLTYIAYLLKAVPWGLDPAPISFLVPGLLYAWATLRLRMLEIAPIAQQAVFQRLSDGVLVFDKAGHLADFNAAGTKIFPELTAALKGENGSELFREYSEMIIAFAGPADEQRTMSLATGGKKFNYQLQRVELYDLEGQVAGFMLILRDITHFSALVEGLQIQAAIDPLTKAWNRNRWQEVGEALLTQAQLSSGFISLILADLDKFKLVNDTYGHLAGDAVLREFAQTCRKNLRSQDVFGRYGGDEFVIILPGVNTARAVELAERLRSAVESLPIVAGEQIIKITASFGVITKPVEDSITVDKLVQKADEALYKVKEAGGNRVGNIDEAVKCE